MGAITTRFFNSIVPVLYGVNNLYSFIGIVYYFDFIIKQIIARKVLTDCQINHYFHLLAMDLALEMASKYGGMKVK